MKKLLLILPLLISLLFANEKTAQLSNETSLQESDRKSILALSQVGVDHVKEDVQSYYKAVGAKKWSEYKKVTLKYNTNLFNHTLLNNYDYLITSRYDKLILDGKVKIITPLATMEVEHKIPKYKQKPTKEQNFSNDINNYLNTHFTKKINTLLAGTLDARYKAMSNVDKNSFITNKAKEIGVPVEMVMQLMNSAYSFALHVDPRTSINVQQTEYTDKKGRIRNQYVTSLSLSMPVNLHILKFNPKSQKFESYKSNVAFSFQGSASRVTKKMPDLSFASKLFHDAYTRSFKAGILALQVKLKKDLNFALVSTVTKDDFFNIDISAGVQDAVRVDHPFKILRTIDGQTQQVAWVKVKQPGMNCLAAPVEARYDSTARVISGSPEVYDQVVEYAYSGGYIGLAVTKDSSTLANDWQGANGNYLTLTNTSDKGYISNSPAWSEVYSHMVLSFGMIDSINQEKITPIRGFNEGFTGSYAVNASFGMDKRIYLFSNLSVSLGADLGYEFQSYSGGETGDTYTNDSGEEANVKETLYIGYGYLQPYVTLNYTASPYSAWYLKAGMNFDFATTGSIRYSKDTYDSISLTDEDHGFQGVTQALNVRIGYSFHVDFLGASASGYKKSNGACSKYTAGI